MKDVVVLRLLATNGTAIFKQSINVDSDFVLPTLRADQLFHTLPARIIEVLGIHRRLGSVRLRSENPHTVTVIPLVMARSVFLNKVPVDIVNVPVSSRADGQCREAIGVRDQSKLTCKGGTV